MSDGSNLAANAANAKGVRDPTIHDQVRERVDLAFTYAEDGALRSAERLLRKAADMYAARAEWIEAQFYGASAQP